MINEFIFVFLYHTLPCVPAHHAEDNIFSVMYQSLLVGFMLQDWFPAEFKVHVQISQENHNHFLSLYSPFYPGFPGFELSSPQSITRFQSGCSCQTGSFLFFPLPGGKIQKILNFFHFFVLSI
jgi:hypothetical protein